MNFANERHHDGITDECASVCDRMLRLLERLADGNAPGPLEIDEIAAEVEMLRTALRPPSCAYDFIASAPRCLN